MKLCFKTLLKRLKRLLATQINFYCQSNLVAVFGLKNAIEAAFFSATFPAQWCIGLSINFTAVLQIPPFLGDTI